MLLSAITANLLGVLSLGVNLAEAINLKNLEPSSTLARRRIGVINNFPTVDGCGEPCGQLLYNISKAFFVMAPTCAALHQADLLLDVSTDPRIKDEKTKEQLVTLAKALVSGEKNTADDWTKSPSLKLNSLYCREVPRHPILNGLHFKQAPGNDPNLFFNPDGKKTIKLDDIPETRPLEFKDGKPVGPVSGTSSDKTVKGTKS
ncbi:uncharacterized protein MELLADRAFT_113164 [Melampsora larici-populina 98AG31]|uniref:Secreted protein n=1 Tax=Melampsora larici-populina (strain 98AG31 / pathotype 3-4-7) TaxID=747676 RepID=F4S8Y7_MELLP|nr:uncharacterized protein MELLADRAFT_113164 [Melampsora larici-populina 98AG31]EGF98890.1 hypothetical protein MELLADRAFT_113164 [Melampsora larici-populina 98AG31]